MADPDPFAAFDPASQQRAAPPSAPAATSADDDPFARYGQPGESWGRAAVRSARNVGQGAVSGAVAGNLGAPVDILNLLGRMGRGQAEAEAGIAATPEQITSAFPKENLQIKTGSSEHINELLGSVGLGINALPEDQRHGWGATIGQGIGAFAAPTGVGQGIGLARGTVSAGRALANAARSGILGATSGAGSKVGEELAPEGYEPVGAVIGGLTSPLAFEQPFKYAGKFATAVLPGARSRAAERGAVQQFYDQASNPQRVADSLATEPHELIPGAPLTTGQVTQDPGILAAQYNRQSQNGPLAAGLQAQQGPANEAVFRHMEAQAPGTGTADDVRTLVQDRLKQIDEAGEEAANAGRTTAEAALPTPTMTPELREAQARGAIEAGTQPARQRVAGALGEIGGEPAMGTQAEQAEAWRGYGAGAREPNAAALAVERKRLDDLRATIDPTGTMGMRPDAIKGAIAKIDEMFPVEGGAQLSGAERGLYGTVNSWGNLIPIERAFQLRANINGRIRGLQGSDPQEALRLGVLKNGVDDAIAQAVNDISVGERAGVIHQDVPPIHNRFLDIEKASNAPPRRPQDLIEFLMERGGLKDEAGELSSMDLDKVNRGYFGRLSRQNGMPLDDARELAAEAGYLHPDSDVNDLINALHRNQSGNRVFREGDPAALDWMDYESARRSGETEIPFGNAAAGRGETGSGVSARSAAGATAPGGGALSARGPSRGQEATGFPGAAGNRGISQEPLTSLTPEARATFAGWNAGYREMRQKFSGETPGTLHAVGKLLQRGGPYGEYRLTDAEAMNLFVGSGANKREAAQKLLAAAPEGADVLDNALSFSLRRAAQRSGDVIDVGAYQSWLRNNGSVLSLRPELQRKFGNIENAQRALDDVNASIKQHAGSHPMAPGWENAQILSRSFKPGAEGAAGMRRYFQLTGNSPAAIDAAVDHIAYRFGEAAVRNGEVNPRLAENWLRKHDEALSTVPELKQRFANTVEAQKSLENSISEHLRQREDFTKSLAGAFLSERPDEAVGRMFKGDNRASNARALMDQVQGSPAAREGVQRTVIDFMRRQFEGTALGGSEYGAAKAQKAIEFLRDNRDVLGIVFPGKQAAFDALGEHLRRQQLVGSMKVNKAGSPTAELTAGREPGHGGGMSAAMAIGLEHALEGIKGAGLGVAHALGTALVPITLGAKTLYSHGAAKLAEHQRNIYDQLLLEPGTAQSLTEKYGVPGPQRSAAENFLRGAIQRAYGVSRIQPQS